MRESSVAVALQLPDEEVVKDIGRVLGDAMAEQDMAMVGNVVVRARGRAQDEAEGIIAGWRCSVRHWLDGEVRFTASLTKTRRDETRTSCSAKRAPLLRLVLCAVRTEHDAADGVVEQRRAPVALRSRWRRTRCVRGHCRGVARSAALMQ